MPDASRYSDLSAKGAARRDALGKDPRFLERLREARTFFESRGVGAASPNQEGTRD